MRRIETMFETAARTAREALVDFAASLTPRQQSEEAFAYVEARDDEELIEAAQRVAIIRERMRREGLLR